MSLNLTETPEPVNWPAFHYVCIEKTGPIDQTAEASWKQLVPLMGPIKEKYTVTNYLALYKLDNDPNKRVYRAGLVIDSAPTTLPSSDLRYLHFPGGKYAKFTLKGPHSKLPEACGQAFHIVEEKRIALRNEAFNMENYLNDPHSTPEDELLTEILIAIV